MEASLTKKFEIGQQWRCRDGSRAIILKVEGDYLLVWSECCDGPFRLGSCGVLDVNGPDRLDLIEPWVEKRTEEVEVFMYENGGKPIITTAGWLHKDKCYKLLARKKIAITEGEGL